MIIGEYANIIHDFRRKRKGSPYIRTIKPNLDGVRIKPIRIKKMPNNYCSVKTDNHK
jgi:hypothetical protein